MTASSRQQQDDDQPTRGPAGDRESVELFIFCDGNESYGVPPDMVIEVVTRIEPTPVPFVPDWVEGVVSVRGEIVPVVDLARYFGLQPAEHVQRNRLILFGIKDVTFTMWSDRIVGIEIFSTEQLEPPLSTLPRALQDSMSAQLRHQGLLVYVLEMQKLLENSREQVATS